MGMFSRPTDASTVANSSKNSKVQEEPLDMFRCTPMTLLQLYIPSEATQTTIAELGQLELLQFRDLNENLQPHERHFTPELLKLSELENKLDLLLKATVVEGNSIFATSYHSSNAHWVPPSSQELNEQEAEINRYEERISEMSENVDVMEKKLKELQEYSQVLSSIGLLLNQNDYFSSEQRQAETVHVDHPLDKKSSSEPLNSLQSGSGDYLPQFIVGTVQQRKYAAFERVLWRAMRGNVYMNKADLSEIPDRVAFVAYAHGVSGLSKIKKICLALGCRIYDDIGEDFDHRTEQLVSTDAQIADITNIIFNTRQAKFAEISGIASALSYFKKSVLIQKTIYSVLNLMRYDSSRKSLIAEAWCPTSLVSRVDEALQIASERAGLEVSSIVTVLKPGNLSPPTYFPSNRFTRVFQDINDAYGVACYGEANPAIFMIITFPFLFSLMFGDLGHAVIMLMASVVMIMFERGLARPAASSEMFSMIFDGRYIIVLMGLFSVYAGLIYNDAFSKSLSIFTSMFLAPSSDDGSCGLFSPGYVYPFGFDPKWNHASNNLNFTNAVKLKLSIVIAILHMNLGICLSAVNYYHDKDWQSLAFHFLPQFMFFNCLFGYMAWMIVWKWITGIDRSILNTFIAMMMQLGSVDTSIEAPFFAHQAFLQRCLVTIALLCVPVMILGRPVYTQLQKRRIQSLGYQEANQSRSSLNFKSSPSADQLSTTSSPNFESQSASSLEDDDFGSMVIHESIHAIEFLLGSVSNTASYLRLWALSLAHAQLSEVLWSLCLEGFMGNPIALIFGYIIWFFATIGLMVAMEGLSAFLHALRLHWVEFNSKFYSGQGVAFQPFMLNFTTGQANVVAVLQPSRF